MPPDSVWLAAHAGVSNFYDRAWRDDPAQYGFQPDDLPGKLQLGEPWRQHQLVREGRELAPLAEMVSPLEVWLFPVMAGGQARALLAVEYLDGRWQAVALGYAALARELDQVRGCWPLSKGYHPLLITAFRERCHLFTVPEGAPENLTVLPNGTGNPPDSFDYHHLGSLPAVLRLLAPAAAPP